VEPRDRVLAPIAEIAARDAAGSPIDLRVDFGALVRRLVVSEQLIIRSTGLMELPLLVTKFGYDGVKELLSSGRVRLLCQAMFTANIGQYADRLNGPVLPPGSYSFSALRASPTPEMLSSDLHRIDGVAGLTDTQGRKLRQLAGSQLIRFPHDAGQAAEAEFKRELANNVPLLKTAVALSAQRATGTPIAPDRFQLRVERLSEADWSTEGDLAQVARLTAEEANTIIGAGLSAACGVSVQLETMKAFDALTGLQDNELPLFEAKFDFLARQLDPDAHTVRFTRVCEIAGLPDVSSDPSTHDVDLPRLLEATSTSEAREFREWLRGIDSFTDEQLSAAFHPIKDAIGQAVRGRTGKAVRLATTAGVGILAPPAGIGLGVLDAFLTEKVLSAPGPTAFLSRLYPSVFT
jgi:hypothetical protein